MTLAATLAVTLAATSGVVTGFSLISLTSLSRLVNETACPAGAARQILVTKLSVTSNSGSGNPASVHRRTLLRKFSLDTTDENAEGDHDASIFILSRHVLIQKPCDPLTVRSETGELLFTDVAETSQHLAIDRFLIFKDGQRMEWDIPFLELV